MNRPPTLNQESLNALLIDRQLGELDPDVARLVDAYLERDPEAALESTRLGGVLQQARQSLKSGPSRTLPSRCPTRRSSARWNPIRFARKGPVLGWAVSLALGLAIGYTLADWPVARGPDDSQTAQTAPADNEARDQPARLRARPEAASFWSRSRWVERLASAERRTDRWTGSSLFKKPQLELNP
jgi:hypothetical protein